MGLYIIAQKPESQKDSHRYHCFKDTVQKVLLHTMYSGRWIAFLEQKVGEGKRC